MKKIVLASSNPGKVEEIRHFAEPLGIHILPQSCFNVNEAEETGLTFVENALIKARHASTITQMPTLADDSGLIVDALDGRPGIYSARYAGKNSSHAEKIQHLLVEMADIPEEQRTARFYCAIVLLRYPHDPAPIICEGSWEGRILFATRGEYGFGYDPIFYVPQFNCTSAELDITIKNQISHRAQALQKLLAHTKNIS